jgi:transposase
VGESESLPCMPKLKIADIEGYDRADLERLPREELEDLLWRLLELTRHQANQLGQNSTNSSRPPSSDDPYRRSGQGGKEPRNDSTEDGDQPQPGQGEKAAGEASAAPAPAKGKATKRAGKKPGAPGCWRTQPLETTGEDVKHFPSSCDRCVAGTGRGLAGTAQKTRQVSAHLVCDLERGEMGLRITVVKHCYFAATCDCGHEAIARPGVGLSSEIEGRRRNLQMSERCLVGPMLATFIGALSLRHRLSRTTIQEFLKDWLGLELGKATINRCIHEFGRASEPVVEELLKEVQAAEIANIDETPWYEKGALRWLWVVVTATTVVFHIGSRRKEELIGLIGEAFLGWLVSDGYCAYRDHPRRQRCLAHLIRKAVALAEGYYGAGSSFGRELARDLRRLIEKVAQGDQSDPAAASIRRLTARIKRNCEFNRHEIEEKVRALAREILNDWDAVIAFVSDPTLPPTNNDAERALRHAVIARRISFGTRTDEGSRFYAAAMSVIDTCRKRRVDTWAYARDLIAAARKGAELPKIPAAAVA